MIYKSTTRRRRGRNCAGSSARRTGLRSLLALCTWWLLAAPVTAQLAEDASSKPLLFRLDPATRWKLLGCLVLIVLLGIFAMVAIRLVGKLVRRYTEGPPQGNLWGTPTVANDEWAASPLHDPTTGWQRSSHGSGTPEDQDRPDRGSIAT
ncbi:MAG: hypothetical protein KatS3mg110_4355 [Pirellulaceae bacterium]|nr:MAG: hypothetical protein KatS3mg110_4355 [Pirellulaceae bacterium]